MDTALFKSRILDIRSKSEISGKPQFMGFLSEEERAFAENILSTTDNFIFFGGADNAARTMLGLFPKEIKQSERAFPITAITLKFRLQDKLSHRDFLGAVLALGIKREAIGDILIGEGKAVLFATDSVAKLILSELKTVGRVGVKAEKGFSGELPSASERIETTATVSSLRVDCILAAICSCSRNTANEWLNEKRVSVNSVICEKATKILAEGDKITVRGKGKFTLKQVNGETRKGRLKITIQKYN